MCHSYVLTESAPYGCSSRAKINMLHTWFTSKLGQPLSDTQHSVTQPRPPKQTLYSFGDQSIISVRRAPESSLKRAASKPKRGWCKTPIVSVTIERTTRRSSGKDLKSMFRCQTTVAGQNPDRSTTCGLNAPRYSTCLLRYTEVTLEHQRKASLSGTSSCWYRSFWDTRRHLCVDHC